MAPPGSPRIAFEKGKAKVTADLDDTWQVEYGLALMPPRRPVVVELHVSLRPGAVVPPGGLSSETLRKVRAAGHAAHLREMLRELRKRPTQPALLKRHEEEVKFRENWLRWAGLGPAVDTPTRGAGGRVGRPRLSDELLARAAEAYVTAVNEASPRPVQDAAARLGDTTPERLRDLLHRARIRGLLAASVNPGLAGGTLTALARAVLLRRPSKSRRHRR